jgi:hypothetical protein
MILAVGMASEARRSRVERGIVVTRVALETILVLCHAVQTG